MNTRHVAVLMGGWSAEREVSLSSGRECAKALEAEALSILAEDRRMCSEMGRYGSEELRKLLKGRSNATLMTHCNAGALATGGIGTALAVMYAAKRDGVSLKVFADETRPLLQGARLTSWELARAGIDVTVICDNMAAAVMREKKPDMVVVGADRIAGRDALADLAQQPVDQPRRRRALLLLADTIKDPTEIWWNWVFNSALQKFELRRTYLKTFEVDGEQVRIIVGAEIGRDGWKGTTAFSADQIEAILRRRGGVMACRRSQNKEPGR